MAINQWPKRKGYTMESETTNLIQPPGGEYPFVKTIEEVIVHAQRTMPPDRILLQRADGESLTVGEYLSNVGKICNMLLDLGVEKEHNVGVFLPNCLEYSYLYMVLGRLGVTIVPINQFLKGDSLSFVLNHCDIDYLVTSKELFVDKIVPIARSLKSIGCILFIGEEIQTDQFRKTLTFSNFRRYPPEFRPSWNVRTTDVQGIWLTSGTTGLPKGVIATQEYLLQRLPFLANLYKLLPSDVIYFVLPMYHQPFFLSGVALAMFGGCKLVFVDWFSASKFWEHIVKYRCTITYTTGTIMAILLKQEVGSFEKEGRELIRLWVPWPFDQPEVAVVRWPKTKFLLGYGLSEYCHAATHSLGNPETGSQGPATPFTELKICDPETGKELPAGKIGEIVVKSNLGPAYMMQGYYKSSEETERVLKNGWLHTGDAGYLDEKNFLHFLDRLKDSIRVAGENVPSVEVETIIKSHPKVMEAAIVGVKGELGHDEIMAHVVLNKNEELAPEEFFEFCIQKLAYFMVPKHLCIREELPKTATLRVQKYKLREEGIRPGCFVRKVSPKKK